MKRGACSCFSKSVILVVGVGDGRAEGHCVVTSGLLAWSTCWHARVLVAICGAFGSMLSGRWKKGRWSCRDVGSGSGKFGTPWERMQPEKASTFWELVDGEVAGPPAFGEPPAPAEDGLLHAAASRARPAVAMIAAAARAVRAPARRRRRRTRGLWFIMPSSGAGWWLRPAGGAHRD